MENMFSAALLSAGFSLLGVTYIAVAGIFMYTAYLISNKLSAVGGLNVNEEIEKNSNLAVGLRRAGFLLAIPLGMSGAITGESKGILTDVVELLLDGVFVTIFMFVSRAINDTLVIHGVKNTGELKKGNIAVGLAECGGYLATGIIAMASFTGDSGGVWSAVIFFVIGQVTLLLATVIYEKITPWEVVENIKQGNTAAGLMLGGVMIAIAIALYGVIAGDSAGWVIDLIFYVSQATVSIALLMLSPFVFERYFLPGTSIRVEIEDDQNVAAASVVVAMKIAVALMIAVSVG